MRALQRQRAVVALGRRIPGRSDLLILLKNRAGVWTDSIGLSSAALLAALPEEHKSIYFADTEDAGTNYSDSTIITNIEESKYLNDGGELVGTVANRYAQYADGTSEVILRRVYRYLGATYPMPSNIWDDSATWNDSATWSD